MGRHRNFGIRKICSCGRSRWPRCSHSWYVNFKPKGGRHFRFSLDVDLGRHIDSKTEAEHEAIRVKSAILAGTFERAADRYAREQREAAERPAASPAGVTLDAFAKVYVERVSQVREVRVRGENMKDDETRCLPISSRLAA